jgi:hypothetical protein
MSCAAHQREIDKDAPRRRLHALVLRFEGSSASAPCACSSIVDAHSAESEKSTSTPLTNTIRGGL